MPLSTIYHNGVRVMVFDATFNNISVISCSILLVEETGGPRENNKSVASHWQTWLYNVVSSTPRNEWDSNFEHISLIVLLWFLTNSVLYLCMKSCIQIHFVNYKKKNQQIFVEKKNSTKILMFQPSNHNLQSLLHSILSSSIREND